MAEMIEPKGIAVDLKTDLRPNFAEPWQAKAFALAVALNESGHLDWKAWTEELGSKIAASKEEEAYFESWVRALEDLVLQSQLVDAEEIDDRSRAWLEVLRDTPHGKPLELKQASEQ